MWSWKLVKRNFPQKTTLRPLRVPFFMSVPRRSCNLIPFVHLLAVAPKGKTKALSRPQSVPNEVDEETWKFIIPIY